MEIIYGGRGQGKTVTLIKMSSERNIPILVTTETECKRILKQAEKLNVTIPTPITWNDIISGNIKPRHINSCVIDETEYFLDYILGGIKVEAFTLRSYEDGYREGCHIQEIKRGN